MKSWRLASYLINMVFALPVYAGQDRGNGGDLMICDTENTYELLDFYEGRTILGLESSLGNPELSVSEKIELAWSRLNKFDSERADRFRQWTADFDSERNFVDVPLPDIEDSGYIYRRSGCYVAQIAIQKIPKRPFEPRYLINETLWNKLNNDSKAGLIIHEIIYRDALEHGHLDSINTRYLTIMIASGKISALTQQQYQKMMRYDIHMDTYVYQVSYEDRIRYFPFLRMNFSDAKNFCLSAAGGRGVIPIRANYVGGTETWLRALQSSMGRKIVGEDDLGNAQLWIQDNQNREAYLFDFARDWKINEKPNVNELHEVACATYGLAKSPRPNRPLRE